MIHLQQVSKKYRTDRVETTALDNINLEVEAGEFISVMGPSGCGKSTLLNLMGLLDEPSAGKVAIGGKAIDRYGDRDLARLRNERIGFIFQQFHLVSDLSVVDNVEIPLLYRKMSNKDRRKAALAALDRVGLSSRTRPLPHAALGRPAAAGGHRPRHRGPAGVAARGRAHGQPRQPDGRRDHGHPGGSEPEREDHDRHGHPRSTHGREDPPGRPSVRRPAGSVAAWRPGGYWRCSKTI